MPTVNHVVPWMCYPTTSTPKKKDEITDIFTNNNESTDSRNEDNCLKTKNDFEENCTLINTNEIIDFANNNEPSNTKNKDEINIADVNIETITNDKNNLDKTNDDKQEDFDIGKRKKGNTERLLDIHKKNNSYKRNRADKTIGYEADLKIMKYDVLNNDNSSEVANNGKTKKAFEFLHENKKIVKDKVCKTFDSKKRNPLSKRKGKFIKQRKWRMNLRVLITLVVLNVTGQGLAVEVTTNTLASLLGYPSTCTLGSEVRPCTLSITCWLRGGTRLRGCGGWLFSCCQQHDNTWDSFDNNIPSSDWTYKVSPPRLRQVPQRNVMPNNVFRRRVDDDVTQVECGVPSNRILQKRIIGGREARFAEFPWQAHVRISEFQCGGVLVSQWYVATAAHCVSRAHIRDIVVWLGALDTSAGSQTARKVGVHKKILHPLFQFRMTQPDRYDIALLKLSRPINFSRYIRAICLPETAMALRGRSAVIAGWGKTDATDTHTGTNMLRSATVPILSKEQCITWHQSKQISVEIHSEMICAGHSDGHQDACLGDSGGPLIVPENGRYYLVGITSAGFGCGVDHQPGIYHNVQVTASWIRGVIHEDPRRYNDNYM